MALLPFSVPILVMQAAHPDIGAAVAQYSVYRQEPWGRLFRTGFSLVRFLYGGKKGKQSRDEVKALRQLHANIKGRRADGSEYFALTPATFRVVPDTFLAGILRFREEMHEPLSPAEKTQLFEEYVQLCLLFRIPRSALENNLDEFEQYFDDLLLGTMTYNETVAFLLEEMMKFGPRVPLMPLPRAWSHWLYSRTLYPLIRLFTVGFLDPRFRAKHRIPWSDRDERNYRRWVRAVRVFRRLTPRWLRYSPFSLYIMAGGHGFKTMDYSRLKKMLNR
ncbi:DUF2236 domain-containing protein [Proteobacteria bacterium 005FR1]|nr:DUF2236 domain-containing protein [Proteobacteria bacterium 005FR1]